MQNQDAAMRTIEIALAAAGAEQAEVVLIAREHGLTRLANGGIHQNIATADTQVRVRAVVGKRIGVATGNRTDDEGLRALARQAVAIARVAEPNPEFVSLPEGGPAIVELLPIDAAALTPEARAEVAGVVVREARAREVIAAGHVATTRSAVAVGNSLGVRAYHEGADADVMAIMTRGDASGYDSWAGTSLADAPAGTIAARAAETCRACALPITVEPGPYTVILEPPAVAEMLFFLAYMGLGATAVQEGRSFMVDKMGERLVGENITLRDNAHNPATIRLAFDFEGAPARPVTFFERGVARDVVYDSGTAHKGGHANTGHALPAPNAMGPFPTHLELDPGAETREELLAGVERGILVTRFHYVNVVHPKETIFTGMTRDGTFLIENGRPVAGIKNLRFTQRILEALCHVTGIENRRTLVNQDGVYCLVPTLRVEGFGFTS